MPTQEEVYAILMRVEGQDKVEKLTKALAEEERQLGTLIAQLRSAGATQEAILAATAKHTTAISALRNEYGQLSKSMASMDSRGFGNALTQLGYAADDAQYGLRGLTNNIQPLAQSLGAGAGLAGTIGIAITAAYQLYTHWDQLMDVMGMGKVRTEAQAMEELARATEKTAEQTEKLLRYQERQATIASQRQGKSSAESEMGQAVNKAIAEGGSAEAVRGLAQSKIAAGDPRMKQIDADQKREEFMIRTLRRTPSPEFYQRFEARRNKVAEQIDKEAREELARAATDPSGDSARALLNKVTSNPGAFGPNADKLASGLVAALPENIKGARANEQINAKADAAARVREASQRERDADGDYEWQTLQDSNASWKAFKNRQKQANSETNSRFGRLGGDQALDIATMGSLRNGANPDALMKAITNQLAGTIGGELAAKKAQETVDSARGKLMSEKPEKRISSSQELDAASLASYYQAGVNNKDKSAEQLEQIKQSASSLRSILQELRRTRRTPATAG